MTDLKPGTPEYQQAYEKEMQRLEAEAAKDSDKKESKVETTSEVKAETKTDEVKTESADEIKARLEKAERDLQAAQKAIKDTQRWGHRNAEEVSRLKREAEERKHRETLADDAVLKANPGLEDTIKRVAGQREETKPAPKEMWLASVSKAIPDVEELLGDQSFFARAKEKQVELGPDWDDPFVAIRELSELKVAHQSEKRAQAAVEAARKDFEVKSKKRTAMEVPGGSGGKDTTTSEDDVAKWRTMSKEEFDKARSKVMGY
jgi:dTMP kinase